MTEKKEIYKCDVCGNIIEVLENGGGILVCCGKPMRRLVENSDDKASKEKHVPIINNTQVLVGVVAHPMTEEHFIQWVEGENNTSNEKIFLKPGQKPEAGFCFKPEKARAYCNLHGLWKS